jgi:uncharacterized protein GlcG (DUF336 family)
MNTFQQLKFLSDVLEEVATERSIPICITIVDVHGSIVLLHRMPGSPILALEMSERKAYTSIVMRCETASLAAQILPGQPLYSLTSSSSKLVAFGGGSFVNLGQDSFGVGISGGTAEEDVDMLEAGRVAFGMGRWADTAGADITAASSSSK